MCGTLINPLFSTKDIIYICGKAPIPVSTKYESVAYIGEEDTYSFLELLGNEYSCDLFQYITNKLSSLRLEAANRMKGMGSFVLSRDVHRKREYGLRAYQDYKKRVEMSSDLRDTERAIMNLSI